MANEKKESAAKLRQDKINAEKDRQSKIKTDQKEAIERRDAAYNTQMLNVLADPTNIKAALAVNSLKARAGEHLFGSVEKENATNMMALLDHLATNKAENKVALDERQKELNLENNQEEGQRDLNKIEEIQTEINRLVDEKTVMDEQIEAIGKVAENPLAKNNEGQLYFEKLAPKQNVQNNAPKSAGKNAGLVTAVVVGIGCVVAIAAMAAVLTGPIGLTGVLIVAALAALASAFITSRSSQAVEAGVNKTVDFAQKVGNTVSQKYNETFAKNTQLNTALSSYAATRKMELPQTDKKIKEEAQNQNQGPKVK